MAKEVSIIRDKTRNQTEYYEEKQQYNASYKDQIRNKMMEFRDNDKEIVTKGLVETLDEFIDGQGLEQAEGILRRTDLSEEKKNELKKKDSQTTVKQTNIAVSLLNERIPDMSLNKRTTERAINDHRSEL